MQDTLERIESIKAGSLGGIAVGIIYGVTIAFDLAVFHKFPQSLLSLGMETSIAIVSGFLFGVTYRYVIRTDRNAHLNDGAVLAFGLVRGFALVDVSEFTLSQVWIDGLIVGKSVVMFAIARYAIDYALNTSWILPFTHQRQQKITDLDLADPSAAIPDVDKPSLVL